MLPFPHFLVEALPSFPMSHNATLLAHITPTELGAPFYHMKRQHMFDWISDRHLSLFAPIAVYWVLSTVFEVLDTVQLPYFEARRIHESDAVKARNRATFWQVIRAVVLQQAVQTVFGLLILEGDESVLKTEINRDHVASMAYLAPRVADLVFLVLGKNTGLTVLDSYGPRIVNFVYWWGIPTFQMFFALSVSFSPADC